MKRILINEEQEELIKRALYHEDAMSKLPVHLLNDLKRDGTSLSVCDFFNTHRGKQFLETMLLDRYDEAKSNFSDDVTNVKPEEVVNKLNKIVSICKKKEQALRPQLEKLCYNILTELFEIPEDSFDFECHLVDNIPADKEFNVYPEPSNVKSVMSSEEIETDDKEIQKRRILDVLCIGGAKRIADKARTLYLDKVFEMDEELPHLYSKMEKLNELSLFMNTVKITDKNNQQGGYVEVTLPTENSLAKINANAILFPILLNQSIEGLFELFASFGLPDSEDSATNVMRMSDALMYEPWDMRIGPALFDKVFKNNVPYIDSNDIPYVFSNVAELDCSRFLNLIEETTEETEKGAEIVKNLYSQALHDKQYNGFEGDIEKKQDDKSLVTDDLDEEIDEEAEYPQQFSMEEFKNIRSYASRIKYCNQNLMRIAAGSSRAVYDIDGKTVLKLAMNRKGIAQNEEEGRHDYYRDNIGLFAKVYDKDDENYLWIEMERARKARANDFMRIEGFSFRVVCEFLAWLMKEEGLFAYVDPDMENLFESEEFREKMYNENNIFDKLENYVKNYNIGRCVGDLGRISSWGVVIDENNQEKLVLIDYGLTPDVYDDYYARR